MPSPLAVDLAHRIAHRFNLHEQEHDAERRLAELIDMRMSEILMTVDGYVPDEPFAPEPPIPLASPLNGGNRVAIAGGSIVPQPCGCPPGRGQSQERIKPADRLVH